MYLVLKLVSVVNRVQKKFSFAKCQYYVYFARITFAYLDGSLNSLPLVFCSFNDVSKRNIIFFINLSISGKLMLLLSSDVMSLFELHFQRKGVYLVSKPSLILNFLNGKVVTISLFCVFDKFYAAFALFNITFLLLAYRAPKSFQNFGAR